MITEIIFHSFLLTFAVWLIFMKLDIRKVIGYDVWVDISFSLVLAWFLKGTYAGAMVAIVSGLMLGILLFATKKVIGAKRLIRTASLQYEWRYFPPEYL